MTTLRKKLIFSFQCMIRYKNGSYQIVFISQFNLIIHNQQSSYLNSFFFSLSMTLIKFYNNFMKNINMKVPALCQLYQNKSNYEAHKRKLTKIKSEQKESLLQKLQSSLQLSSIRKNAQSYEHRHNSKTLEMARSNIKMMLKLERVTSEYALKSVPCLPYHQPKNAISKNKLTEQKMENFRIRNKVKSMSSCLNNTTLLKDYRKSLKIKNRLMHYQTEKDKRVVLKIGKYLSSGSSKKKYQKDNERFLTDQSINRLPKVLRTIEQKISKSIVTLPPPSKINLTAFYKKEDILNNIVDAKRKIQRFAKSNRLKTSPDLHIIELKMQDNESCFPTEPKNTINEVKRYK